MRFPRKSVVPCMPWENVKDRGGIGYIFWFFDKVGWFLEQTPLCVFFCSFWLDLFLPKAKAAIQQYREGNISRETCEKRLRQLDRRIYCFFIAGAMPALCAMAVVAFWAAGVMVLQPSTPRVFFAVCVALFTTLTVHEVACPSCYRHHDAALRRGDHETAGMNERASPGTRRYFRKEILGMTPEDEARELEEKFDRWIDVHFPSLEWRKYKQQKK